MMIKFIFKTFLMTIVLNIVTDFTLFSQSSPGNDKIVNDVVLELNPTESNPRNSEGAFITLSDGTIMFAYTRYYGGAADHSKADIVGRYSADGGNTWTEKDQILVKNDAEQNVMSVSLLRLQDGRIALFYLRKNGLHDCRLVMKTSSDEGKSWADAILTIPAPGYFVVNNDRVVQLESSRIIVPAAYHRRKGEDTHDMKNFDGRAMAIFFISENNGDTWRESKSLWTLPVASGTGLQEPGIIELNDGRLFSWARTDQGCQYGMWSFDDGDTWSPPQPTQFRSPNSPLSMKRFPNSNHLLAIWNDHSGRFALYPIQPSTAKRTPLVSAISEDEGKTWKHFKQIESNPDEGYCYTAIHFIDDSVLLAYCAGDAETKGCLNRLRIRKIKLDWFYLVSGE
jgi:predicted neuraminidase